MSEQLGNYRVVDLSKHLDPATSKRLCKLRRFYQDTTKDYHSDLEVESHLGTHVETPYHYNDAWKDVLGLPVTSFMGRGVLLKLACGPRERITSEMLEAADNGRLREGDIAVLDSPFQCEPFSNDPGDQRPLLCRESGDWLAGKKVKCIAFGDGVSIEHSIEDSCDMHEAVLPHDITFLEVIKNLDQLESDIFLLIFQPMPIKGLDSCCVRAIAIEGIPGFCS
jgi:kynurenine formamidase